MSAVVIQYPGKNRSRSTLLEQPYTEILLAMRPFRVGTPVSRKDICDATDLNPLAVEAAMGLLQQQGLTTLCADPANHFRLTQKGWCASHNGAIIHERTDSLLAKAGLKKIGERHGRAS